MQLFVRWTELELADYDNSFICKKIYIVWSTNLPKINN